VEEASKRKTLKRPSPAEAEAESAGAVLQGVRDQLLRERADFENYRKRIDREKAEWNWKSRAETLQQLLPVLDNMDRALELLNFKETPPDWSKGVAMVHQQFLEVLGRLGLDEIEAEGASFHPGEHEAVSVVHRPELEENRVVQVFEKGYRLKGKILRPAKVSVNRLSAG
jgi:molecular chaperone GrpE